MREERKEKPQKKCERTKKMKESRTKARAMGKSDNWENERK